MANNSTSANHKKIAELAQQIADHQANLQIIGSNWGEEITDRLDASEKKFLAELTKKLKNFDYSANTKKTLDQLDKIAKKLAEIREKAISEAREEIERQAHELAENEAKWGKKVTKEISEKDDAKKLKDPSETMLGRVVSYSLSNGKTLNQWFQNIAESDFSRLQAFLQNGFSSGLTIQEMISGIIGTAEGNYIDGIFNTTRNEAENIARTLCNGIANSAKEAFYNANDDVINGVEILSTLDGRTCPVCASLDRKRYKLGESHPSLPLHPRCRCVLLPVTPASDFADEQRPMANADFMAEAQRSYEAKNKGKKFSDLDDDQKKKLYYQAMREYEKQTGEPAYEQSDGAISFRDYFNEHMTEQQRKDWLGPERYKLWKKGNIPLDKFIPPYPQKRMTVEELKKLDKASFEK